MQILRASRKFQNAVEMILENLFLLRSQIDNKKFDDGTLRIMESVLVAKDVKSLLETRSAVREILRSAISSVLGDIREKSTVQKLYTVDFFVKAFAIVGDVESYLALRYEALVLRETKCMIDPGLRVSCEEWFTFAQNSLDDGFYAIAAKGFENALLCLQSNDNVGSEFDSFLSEDVISNIRDLRDIAVASVALHSVQTESANYLKRKAIYDEQRSDSCSSSKEKVASLTFRSGIKRRNMKKLYQSLVSRG